MVMMAGFALLCLQYSKVVAGNSWPNQLLAVLYLRLYTPIQKMVGSGSNAPAAPTRSRLKLIIMCIMLAFRWRGIQSNASTMQIYVGEIPLSTTAIAFTSTKSSGKARAVTPIAVQAG